MELLGFFITIVLFFAPIACFIVIGLAVFAGIAFIIFRAAGAEIEDIARHSPQKSQEFLEAAVLRPWESGTWVDLSSRWEGTWRSVSALGRQEGYTQGVVRSLNNPARPGWIAFTVRRQQFKNARVILKTSDRRVELTVTGQGVFDPNLKVETVLDGRETGTLTVTYPACVYRSADGAVEAQWMTPVRMNQLTHVMGRVLNRDVKYNSLSVNGRQIAAINDTWVRNPHPESTAPIHPALQSTAGSLTPAEEGALLIALGLALYYDSIRRRLRGAIHD